MSSLNPSLLDSNSHSSRPPSPSLDLRTHDAHLSAPPSSLLPPPPDSGLKAILGVSGPVPKWIPVTLLAFSSVAMVIPVLMLRRYKANPGHVHLHAQTQRSSSISATAPPRRGRGRGEGPGSSVDNSQLEVPPATSTSPSIPPPRIRLRGHTLPPSSIPAPSSSPIRVKPTLKMPRTTMSLRKLPVEPPSVDQFNAPLHSLKAFTIATALVVGGAAASITGIMAYLGVSDTTEFAARMRTWVSHTMPVLTAQIHRRLTPSDSLSNMSLPSTSYAYVESPALTPFDHDAAESRLAEAFEEGGFDAWVEAAAREMEVEAEVERSRRIHGGSASGGQSSDRDA
ncbi:hypothetical protein BDN67DRAFT_974661 [Paxillus ammoniavirescens]|nr:hypothetical protein BDN67DRAFT_974661 [Paxillus ammoniavirescens]